MKKRLLILFLLFSLTIQRSDGQVLELIKIVTEKIIRAIDLKVQRMQSEVMNLQLLEKQAENTLSKNSLDNIAKLTSDQKELYRNYFASLVTLKQTVTSSALVVQVLKKQKALVVQYNEAVSAVTRDPHFTELEKAGFTKACASIIDAGAALVQTLEQTLQNRNIQATDAERIKLITRNANELDGLLYKLQTLYMRQRELSVSRSKSEEDAKTIRALYGLQ